MRTGRPFAINIEKTAVDFTNEYTAGDEDFPSATVFDFAEWRKEENHMKILKEGENKNIMGDVGAFMLHADFMIVLIISSNTEDQFNEAVSMIPGGDAMKKYKIV